MIRRMDRFLLLSLFVWLIANVSALAQQPLPAMPAANQDATKTSAQQPAIQPASASPAVGQEGQSYRIGPGDLLAIRVFGRPELGSETRVDASGHIRMPFIQDFQAGCLTEAELANAITEKYKKYLRDPQVDVLIKEYRSQPVAVIGAVAQPGRFQLQRRVRLLELVTFAGGPSNRAGTSVQVIHSADHDYCAGETKEQATPPATAAEGGASDLLLKLSSINLRDLLAGNASANPYVQPGDIVSIPEADQFFVTGSVTKPGVYTLTTKITLTQAVAIAGGVNTEGARNRVRLIRPVPGTEQRKETVYNIDDIQKRKVEDVALQPNDIVEVPGSVARAASRNLLGVGINMLNTLPFFILR
ncbi:MAG: polysaccharide biosynthesis/export family protein [Acidobacteriota bacterium]|nr:polysaccharide biosynthesis/export family protein [Acidobacteriota bacterium]